MSNHEAYMKMAAELAIENIKNGGGPFSAIVIRNGEVIATGCNRVTARHDPTAHAEVEAIREATKKLRTHDLSGCSIYASCEPCPMCLGAIYWARLDNLYFGNSRRDAAAIGFDDEFIYQELEKPLNKRTIPTKQITTHNITWAFEQWSQFPDKEEY